MPSSKTKKKKNTKKEVDGEQVALKKKKFSEVRKKDAKRVLKPLSKASAYIRQKEKRMREGEDQPAALCVNMFDAMLQQFIDLEQEVRKESTRGAIPRGLLNKFNTMFQRGREVMQLLKDKEKIEREHLETQNDIVETMAVAVRDIRNTMGLRMMEVPYIQPCAQPMSSLVSNLTDEWDRERKGSRRGMDRREEQERLKGVLSGDN